MELLVDVKRESGMSDLDLTRSLDWKLNPNVHCRVTLEKIILPSETEFDLNLEGNGGGSRSGGSLERNDNNIDIENTDTHCYRNLKLLIHKALDVFQKCEEKCGVCDKYIQKLFNHLIVSHGDKTTDSDQFLNKNFETQDFLIDPGLHTIPSYENKIFNEDLKPVISRISPPEHVNYFNVINNNLKQEPHEIECQEDPLLNPEDLNCAVDIMDNTKDTDMHGENESNRKFKCLLCPKSFMTNYRLSRHNLTHTGERPYKCETCGKRFAVNFRLTRHKRIHTLEKKFACNKCGKKFVSKLYLSNHDKRVHTGERPYKCETCGARFAMNYHLTVHKRIHSLEKVKPWKYVTTHSLTKPLITSEKPDNKFKCLLCPKSFVTTGRLSKHNFIHTGERPWKCEVCGKRFAVKGNLTAHKTIHTDEKKFNCNKCGKKFVSELYLCKHDKIMHTEDKPFKCITCGKGFVVKREFVRHTATHLLIKQSNNLNFETQVFLSDPRPHTIPSYEKEIYSEYVKPVISPINPPEHVNYFNNINNNLKQEPDDIECLLNPEDLNCAEDINKNSTDTDMLAGEKESSRKFQCLLCPKSFMTNYHLSRHKLTHTGERPHKCETCGRRFALNFQLTAHKRIHNRETPLEECFPSSNNFNRHNMKTYFREKKHKCDSCEKCFSSIYHLDTHKAIHNSEIVQM